ncbi:MAG: autotransporter adhesin family protein [Treponema sp.]|nr:autotransporter adhesin family protein [Treponema sp.]
MFTVLSFINAQTADVIEKILQTEAVTNEQAAWFVLIAANDSGNYDDYNYNQAFRFAVDNQWLSRNARASDKINLRDVSFLLMQAFDISGGPMYTLFKTPHYAYREMLQNDIIYGRAAPGMDVTGDTLLYMVNRILFNMDDNPWDLPPLPPEPEVIIVEEPEPEPEPVALIPEIVEEPEPEVIYNGVTLTERLKWLESNAQDGGIYVFEVFANENIAPHFLYYGSKKVSITLKGDTDRRIVGLTINGSMFSIGSGVTLILDNNLTITGRDDNSESLIIISGGNLIINNGARIMGNTATYGGGVHFMNGAFTMNGGTISGNTALNGSGVYVGYGRTFTMNGGLISGNTAIYGGGVYVSSNGTFNKTGGIISGNNASNYGGGVYVASDGKFNKSGGIISGNIALYSGGGVGVSNGTFTMSGGEISANTAGSSGGGVFVFYYGVFIKTGGIIYGDNNNRNSNAVKDIATNTFQSNLGHAVYASVYSESARDTIVKRMEDNAEENDNLSLTYNNNIPVWSGDWE